MMIKVLQSLGKYNRGRLTLFDTACYAAHGLRGPHGGAMAGPKIIKRYANRKLYDTERSCYVTLDDMLRPDS